MGDRFSTMIPYDIPFGRILVLPLPMMLAFGLGLIATIKDSKWWMVTMPLPCILAFILSRLHS